ncbi:hypothetical protein RUND412_007639 [Rhizina undulata]
MPPRKRKAAQAPEAAATPVRRSGRVQKNDGPFTAPQSQLVSPPAEPTETLAVDDTTPIPSSRGKLLPPATAPPLRRDTIATPAPTPAKPSARKPGRSAKKNTPEPIIIYSPYQPPEPIIVRDGTEEVAKWTRKLDYIPAVKISQPWPKESKPIQQRGTRVIRFNSRESLDAEVLASLQDAGLLEIEDRTALGEENSSPNTKTPKGKRKSTTGASTGKTKNATSGKGKERATDVSPPHSLGDAAERAITLSSTSEKNSSTEKAKRQGIPPVLTSPVSPINTPSKKGPGVKRSNPFSASDGNDSKKARKDNVPAHQSSDGDGVESEQEAIMNQLAMESAHGSPGTSKRNSTAKDRNSESSTSARSDVLKVSATTLKPRKIPSPPANYSRHRSVRMPPQNDRKRGWEFRSGDKENSVRENAEAILAQIKETKRTHVSHYKKASDSSMALTTSLGDVLKAAELVVVTMKYFRDQGRDTNLQTLLNRCENVVDLVREAIAADARQIRLLNRLNIEDQLDESITMVDNFVLRLKDSEPADILRGKEKRFVDLITTNYGITNYCSALLFERNKFTSKYDDLSAAYRRGTQSDPGE